MSNHRTVEDWGAEITGHQEEALKFLAARDWPSAIRAVREAVDCQFESIKLQAEAALGLQVEPEELRRVVLDGCFRFCLGCREGGKEFLEAGDSEACVITWLEALTMLERVVEGEPRAATFMVDMALDLFGPLYLIGAFEAAEPIYEEARDKAIAIGKLSKDDETYLALRRAESVSRYALRAERVDLAIAGAKAGVSLLLDGSAREWLRTPAKFFEPAKMTRLARLLFQNWLAAVDKRVWRLGFARGDIYWRELAELEKATALTIGIAPLLHFSPSELASLKASRASYLCQLGPDFYDKAEAEALEVLAIPTQSARSDEELHSLRGARYTAKSVLKAIGRLDGSLKDDEDIIAFLGKFPELFELVDDPGGTTFLDNVKLLDIAIELFTDSPKDGRQPSFSEISVLKSRADKHIKDGEFQRATDLMRIADRIYSDPRTAQSFEDPITQMNANQEPGVPNLLIAALSHLNGMSNPSETLEVSERHRCPALRAFAWCRLLACFVDSSDIVAYVSAVQELLLIGAACLVVEAPDRERLNTEYSGLVVNCAQLREKTLRSGVNLLPPVFDADSMCNLSRELDTTIIDFRITSNGSFAHLISDRVERLDMYDVTTETWDRILQAARGQSKAGSFDEYSIEVLGELLVENFLEPIEDALRDLPDESRVCFISHGPITGFPLHACPLRYPSNGRTHWVDRFCLSAAPSIGMLDICAKYAEANDELLEGSRDVVRSVSPVTFGGGLDMLPFSALEAAGIDWLLRGKQRLVCCGDQATYENAFSGFKPGVMHFASHVHPNQTHPLVSRLFLHGDSITTAEVATLDLSHLKLVSLNACQTGILDRARSSDGLTFPTALIVAGVPSVWASLWHIDDVASAIQQLRALEGLLSGMTPIQALRSAQIWTRQLSGEDAYDYLMPVFDKLSEDPSRYALDREGIDFIRLALGRLIDEKTPFSGIARWASIQHIGV